MPDLIPLTLSDRGEIKAMLERDRDWCTQAVVASMRAVGIETIILNVDESNQGAIHIYERLGFRRYCEYLRGPAVRKPQAALTHRALLARPARLAQRALQRLAGRVTRQRGRKVH